MVPALVGENPGLTQINIDIIMEHLNLNITPMQAKIVASVFNLTYKLMGVKEDSLTTMVGRNCPGKHQKYMKEFAKRSIHASDRDKGSDSDSDDGDSRERTYQHHQHVGGRDINIHRDFMEVMERQITTMLESVNNGPQAQSRFQFQAGLEATPNPGERKRGRSTCQPFGIPRDITVDGRTISSSLLAPTSLPVPTLPGVKDLPMQEAPIFQAAAEAVGA